MSHYIEVISLIKPKNNSIFPIADVNDLKGGYIQVDTIEEMEAFPSDKIKEGMLCYVKASSTIYQYIDNWWRTWKGTSGGTLQIVDKLEQLEDEELKIKGQLVYVDEINDLRFYNGSYWESFSRIYIQDTAPDDLGGIWIDTSEQKEHLVSNSIIQDMLNTISILQLKIKKMEFAFNNQMDFGDFTNNNYHVFNDSEGIEPDLGIEEDNGGSSEEQDDAQLVENLDVVLGDSAEPVEYKDWVPNARHLIVKHGTYADMYKNKNDFAPAELLYCYDTLSLYIKDPKTYNLIKIGSVSGNDTPIIPDMEGIIQSGDKIAGILFVDMVDSTKSYLLLVKNGELDLYDQSWDVNTLAGNALGSPTNDYYSSLYYPISTIYTSPKINVNTVYCGGENDEYSYAPCSHNFIEISNTNFKDLNLKGLYLHYTEDSSKSWITLPLKGVIKAGSTFLIKGAPCAVYDTNTTKIKVGEPDMYWTKDLTYNSNSFEVNGDGGFEPHTIWDKNGLIKFAYNCSFYISGEDFNHPFKTEPLTDVSLWSSIHGVKQFYVDLVGFGANQNGQAMPNEGDSYKTVGEEIIHFRYFTMDPVSLAVKAMADRNNTKDWTHLNINNTITDTTVYTPGAVKDKKNIFFNKTLLKEGAPNIVTCSFGYDAHITRCFNWASVGYYDEYLRYKKEGDTEWTVIESFKKGDNRDGNGKNWDNEIYNRIRSITTDGTAFTVHKCIIDLLEVTENQKYVYQVGREGAWSDERYFTLTPRTTKANFVHITDLQGFNKEEYQVWRLAAEYIAKNETGVLFSINTGDATQNGNRINEWLDYFQAGDVLFSKQELMYTVGNNDLCPLDVYNLGDGGDTSKMNPINVLYFFTFEHPHSIPKAANGVYIPCNYTFVYGNTFFMSVNSEITNNTIRDLYGNNSEDTEVIGPNIYSETLATWYQSEIDRIKDKDYWKIAYCHEAPFTIIKEANQDDYFAQKPVERGLNSASHLNSVGLYFFAPLLENNGFNLCLCGHKHTYSESRYLRENLADSMKPFVLVTDKTEQEFAESITLDKAKICYTYSNDTSLNWVKYVMCQATGYKQTSNKDLPAKEIPWLQNYFPNKDGKANAGLKFPFYIVWTDEDGEYLGKVNKLALSKDTTKAATFTYNAPHYIEELTVVDGNGTSNIPISVLKNLNTNEG